MPKPSKFRAESSLAQAVCSHFGWARIYSAQVKITERFGQRVIAIYRGWGTTSWRVTRLSEWEKGDRSPTPSELLIQIMGARKVYT